MISLQFRTMSSNVIGIALVEPSRSETTSSNQYVRVMTTIKGSLDDWEEMIFPFSPQTKHSKINNWDWMTLLDDGSSVCIAWETPPELAPFRVMAQNVVKARLDKLMKDARVKSPDKPPKRIYKKRVGKK